MWPLAAAATTDADAASSNSATPGGVAEGSDGRPTLAPPMPHVYATKRRAVDASAASFRTFFVRPGGGGVSSLLFSASDGGGARASSTSTSTPAPPPSNAILRHALPSSHAMPSLVTLPFSADGPPFGEKSTSTSISSTRARRRRRRRVHVPRSAHAVRVSPRAHPGVPSAPVTFRSRFETSATARGHPGWFGSAYAPAGDLEASSSDEDARASSSSSSSS